MGSSDLELGLRLFQAGRFGEAAQACVHYLATRPGDPRALHLLGRVYLKVGKPAEAVALLQRASKATPDDVHVVLALGSARRAAGDPGGAGEAFQRAISLAPATAAAWFNLGLVHRDEGRLRQAALAFRQASRLDAADYDAMQNVVTTLARAVARGEQPFEAPLAEPRQVANEAISIVVCSIDDARLARFTQRMQPHLANREHELVVIRDARSLCEGYRRGWERSRHPIVVFSHDDFSILSDDPFTAIESALHRADVVGLIGSTTAAGPAVLWAGHPHVHGWITHPSRDGRGYETAVMSMRCGVIDGMQTLDGVFLAMRRGVAGRVGFDEAVFDGFHLYDLDFCYRASRLGLNLAVTTDVVGIHESTGRFDAEFERYAVRFLAKYPELGGARGANHWYGARLEEPAQVIAFCEQLRALATTP